MSSQETRPTILNSPILILKEGTTPPHLDLTELMQDFPVELLMIRQRLHIPEEEEAWQLRRVPLQNYAAFFIIYSNQELLKTMQIFTPWREKPSILIAKTNPEGEPIETLALGRMEEKEKAWGSHYDLKRSTGIPIITRTGNIHYYSAGTRFPQKFSCIVQTPRGPVFQMTISRSERRIRGITSEYFNVCAFDPSLAGEIWYSILR